MSEIDHTRLVEALIPAVLDAGACLLRHRAAGLSADRKADGSPVTQADRDAEAILLAALARAAPSIPVIAEEEVSAGRVPAYADRAFLVDALDGTREFVSGGEDFTVNIGLVIKHIPRFGILLAPASGRLFVTTADDRAAAARLDPDRLGETGYRPALSPIATIEPDPAAIRVTVSRSHRSPETEAFLSKLSIAATTGIGSSLKFALIASGEADLYPRFGPTSAWDIAAGHAVLRAAGGTVTTLDGRPLGYLGSPGDFLNPSFLAWGRSSLLAAAGL